MMDVEYGVKQAIEKLYRAFRNAKRPPAESFFDGLDCPTDSEIRAAASTPLQEFSLRDYDYFVTHSFIHEPEIAVPFWAPVSLERISRCGVDKLEEFRGRTTDDGSYGLASDPDFIARYFQAARWSAWPARWRDAVIEWADAWWMATLAYPLGKEWIWEYHTWDVPETRCVNDCLMFRAALGIQLRTALHCWREDDSIEATRQLVRFIRAHGNDLVRGDFFLWGDVDESQKAIVGAWLVEHETTDRLAELICAERVHPKVDVAAIDEAERAIQLVRDTWMTARPGGPWPDWVVQWSQERR